MTEPGSTEPVPVARGRGGSLAVGLFVVVLVGAGVWFWIVSRGTSPAKDAARQFIQELDQGNVAAARARCTNNVDTVELELHAKLLKDWGHVRDITLPATKDTPQPDGTTVTSVSGGIEFGNLNKGFTATLVRSGDDYRIREFKFE